MIINMVVAFCLTYGLDCRIPRIRFVPELPLISSPVEIVRQAHAVADSDRFILRFHWGHWQSINRYQRRELVYHELAHLYGCYHTDEPYHIMNPHAPETYWVSSDGSNWWLLEDKLKGCWDLSKD